MLKCAGSVDARGRRQEQRGLQLGYTIGAFIGVELHRCAHAADLEVPFVLKSILAKVRADEGLQCGEEHANDTPPYLLACDKVTNLRQHGVNVGREDEQTLNKNWASQNRPQHRSAQPPFLP